MFDLLLQELTIGQLILLFVCILIALGFEFVNGFHDTANAVATVIYTNSLKPKQAVLLSGLLNFLGVFAGGIAVAVGIIKLLPVELLVSSGTGAGLAMVLSILLAAIFWNIGTWWKGIPASSSHTLIGSILGVGLAHSLLIGKFGEGVNWSKASEIGLSLLVSPLFGFGLAFVLLLIFRALLKKEELFQAPAPNTPPPRGIRALLVFTCGGVSFVHGSNDGQKGVGIMMLILIGIVPVGYALNMSAPKTQIQTTVQAASWLEVNVPLHSEEAGTAQVEKATKELAKIQALLQNVDSISELPKDARFPVRQSILVADKALSSLEKSGHFTFSSDEKIELEKKRKELRVLTEYAPTWVLLAIAIALGIGTTVGWKRIVVTVGEKIGKSHLTYAQGASAELVAMSTIGFASYTGLPVSTTHVLSSGIAGTMVAQRSGLQKSTVRNILLAWVLTLPVTVALSGLLFVLLRTFVTG